MYTTTSLYSNTSNIYKQFRISYVNSTFTEVKSACQIIQYHVTLETAFRCISDDGIDKFQINMPNIAMKLYNKQTIIERLNDLISKSIMLIIINAVVIANPTIFLLIVITSKTNIPRLTIFVKTINKICNNGSRRKLN